MFSFKSSSSSHCSMIDLLCWELWAKRVQKWWKGEEIQWEREVDAATHAWDTRASHALGASAFSMRAFCNWAWRMVLSPAQALTSACHVACFDSSVYICVFQTSKVITFLYDLWFEWFFFQNAHFDELFYLTPNLHIFAHQFFFILIVTTCSRENYTLDPA